MLWKRRTDADNVLVSAAMRHEQFKTIFSSVHVVDNANLDPMDKFSELRSLINKLNDKCMNVFPHEIYFSFGESMVPYFMGANNLFAVNQFGLASSFGVVPLVLATFAGFNHTRVNI